ncbi:MAG TPA: class I SAM-dependent methyltransferase [Bryobacteraceae bacterium]|nr:class I SAM-dependent methyltransferase [Bryobacteraceae bacterium]
MTERGCDYVAAHLGRYARTLEFLGDVPATEILELGAAPPYPFSKDLIRRYPAARLTAAQHSSAELEKPQEGLPRIQIDGRSIRALHFNAENERWPIRDGNYDLVVCMEVLEHLCLDPCFLFREAHRVLLPGGHFLITTPNLSCMESIDRLLKGESPYRFGVYSRYGVYGRHNREFVPSELEVLGGSSGFQQVRLDAFDVYPMTQRPILAEQALDRTGAGRSLRGQNIFWLGRKVEAEKRPYPESLFDHDPSSHCARISVLRVRPEQNGFAIKLRLSNEGWCTWIPEGESRIRAGIQLLDRDANLADLDYYRIALPDAVIAGQSAVAEGLIPWPDAKRAGFCKIDLVMEGAFWFAQRAGHLTQTRILAIPAKPPHGSDHLEPE